MARPMNSIKKEVTYFKAYAERQEERELVRARSKKEKGIREAPKLDEWRRTNKLICRQLQAIRQLE